MYDPRLGELVAAALAAGYRIESERSFSVVVVRPKSYSKLGVVVLSVIFILAWLTFGEKGFAGGLGALAVYALIYLLQKDKMFEIYLDADDRPQVRRL